ncbi:MAG: hypothetical protein ACE5JP_16835 [Candidatus Bipolaricaulia bacterium]
MNPDALLPSLGEPMLENTDDALAQLQNSLKMLCADRPGMVQTFEQLDADPLTQVTDHVWQANFSGAINWFLISDSGKALAIDYGYNEVVVENEQWDVQDRPEYARPY